jgi:hypothetical protein
MGILKECEVLGASFKKGVLLAALELEESL